ncbi:hypothetical protein AAHA92_16251 [Salvia divinorum]|uniref:Uncharacterized protein n=1 Tax=Salvia divinorum TaxID=28513 RepID=A0ABD1GVE3_SALDI
MSAVVCGKRSNFFEESPSSPPVSKRIRYFQRLPRIQADLSPPLRLAGSPIRPRSSIILSLFFSTWIDRFLGNPLKNLESNIQFSAQGAAANSKSTATRGESSCGSSLPVNGAEWVELLVGQVIYASNVEDARKRVAQALESLQKSVCENVITGVQSFQKESLMQKQQQLEKLLDETTILKQAASIQHERQKEFEEMGQEMQRLKQLVVEYQEQVNTLEAKNYALTMHLRQALQDNSIPGHFKPDVF